jgi:hypothetical protein
MNETARTRQLARSRVAGPYSGHGTRRGIQRTFRRSCPFLGEAPHMGKMSEQGPGLHAKMSKTELTQSC